MSMVSIREWLRDKEIIHIQFPRVTEGDYGLENFVGVPEGVFNYGDPQIEKWLRLKFDCGFGTARVPYFVAWSPTHVYYVSEYDGSTSCCGVLRNPPTLETQ